MSREEIEKEIVADMGLVPTFMKRMPTPLLEDEWRLFKRIELEEGVIPPKELNLIELAVSTVLRCPYCIYASSVFAKAVGATDEELEATVHIAKHVAGWSTYLHGLEIDLGQFKVEIDQVVEHIRRLEEEKGRLAA